MKMEIINSIFMLIHMKLPIFDLFNLSKNGSFTWFNLIVNIESSLLKDMYIFPE